VLVVRTEVLEMVEGEGVREAWPLAVLELELALLDEDGVGLGDPVPELLAELPGIKVVVGLDEELLLEEELLEEDGNIPSDIEPSDGTDDALEERLEERLEDELELGE
jgi:hypothetical protein